MYSTADLCSAISKEAVRNWKHENMVTCLEVLRFFMRPTMSHLKSRWLLLRSCSVWKAALNSQLRQIILPSSCYCSATVKQHQGAYSRCLSKSFSDWWYSKLPSPIANKILEPVELSYIKALQSSPVMIGKSFLRFQCSDINVKMCSPEQGWKCVSRYQGKLFIVTGQ